MPDEDDVHDEYTPMGTGWGVDGGFDPFGDDVFSREIVNISESDWDLDTDALWGNAVDIREPDADASGGELFG